MIRQLAAVSVRTPNIAAQMNSYGEVEPLHMASRYETRLGLSAPDAWGGSRQPACGTEPIRPDEVRAAEKFDKIARPEAVTNRKHGIGSLPRQAA